MVYSPNMSKAFEGSYKTSKSRGAVVFAIEQVSTKDEKNIQPGQPKLTVTGIAIFLLVINLFAQSMIEIRCPKCNERFIKKT